MFCVWIFELLYVYLVLTEKFSVKMFDYVFHMHMFRKCLTFETCLLPYEGPDVVPSLERRQNGHPVCGQAQGSLWRFVRCGHRGHPRACDAALLHRAQMVEPGQPGHRRPRVAHVRDAVVGGRRGAAHPGQPQGKGQGQGQGQDGLHCPVLAGHPGHPAGRRRRHSR